MENGVYSGEERSGGGRREEADTACVRASLSAGLNKMPSYIQIFHVGTKMPEYKISIQTQNLS